MSERIKGEYPALIVLASIVAIALFFVGIGLGIQSEQRIQANNASREHARYAEQYIESTCIKLSGEALSECVHEAIRSSAEHQRAERDLNAQRQMATWAFWLLWASACTIIITAFGVYYVRQTLIEASGATNAAKDAVEETRNIGKAQLRAYINIASVDVTVKEGSILLDTLFPYENYIEGKHVALNVHFKNVGQTPAENIKLCSGICITSYTETDINQSRDWHVDGGGILFETGFVAPVRL